MNSLIELKSKRMELIKRQREMLDKIDGEERKFTDEEMSEYKKMDVDIDQLEKDILEAEEEGTRWHSHSICLADDLSESHGPKKSDGNAVGTERTQLVGHNATTSSHGSCICAYRCAVIYPSMPDPVTTSVEKSEHRLTR